MSSMEFSEEESVGGESVRGMLEDFNSQQMDYEQEYTDDEETSAQLEACVPTSLLKNLNMELNENIISTKTFKKQVDDIIKSQVENIAELQRTCENISSTLQQLPVIREENMERYQQALSEIKDIQNKQNELKALINSTVQIYDDNMASVYSVEDIFDIEKTLNFQRHTAFKSILKDLPMIGQNVLQTNESRLSSKRSYCLKFTSYLDNIEKTKKEITEMETSFIAAFSLANELNCELLEDGCKYENLMKDNLELSRNIDEISANNSKQLQEYEQKSKELQEKLGNLETEINNICTKNNSMSTTLSEIEAAFALSKKNLAILQTEKQEQMSKRAMVEPNYEEVRTKLESLTTAVNDLEICKKNISSMEGKVKSLEDSLVLQERKEQELRKRSDELTQAISNYDKLICETVHRNELLEKEKAKLTTKMSSLRNDYQKEKTQMEASEKVVLDEINQAQSAIYKLEEILHSFQDRHKQCQEMITDLQKFNNSHKGAIEEKYLLVLQKEEGIRSITEEIEECKIEYNLLMEQKLNAVQHIQNVKEIEKQLSSARKESSHTSEMLSHINNQLNDVHNQKITEIKKMLENKKQEYQVSLNELENRQANTNKERQTLQSTSTALTNSFNDISRYPDIFKGELSLLKSFVNYAIGDTPDKPTELVTSTSDGHQKHLHFFSDEESDDFEFQIKEIRTSKRAADSVTN